MTTWLRVDEACVAAGISRATLYRWINTGLPAKRINDVWHVDAATLEHWRAIRATRRALPLRKDLTT